MLGSSPPLGGHAGIHSFCRSSSATDADGFARSAKKEHRKQIATFRFKPLCPRESFGLVLTRAAPARAVHSPCKFDQIAHQELRRAWLSQSLVILSRIHLRANPLS